MRIGIKLVALSAVCLLSSCATAYQPDGVSGGYSDQRMNGDTVQVSFRGNLFSTPEALHTYLLRRCADVTLQNGYNYFVLVSNEPPNEQKADVFGGKMDSATIKMFKGDLPASAVHAYDAAAVVRSTPVELGEVAESLPPPSAASMTVAGRTPVNPNAPTNQPPSFENMY
jgi:hypothetical protein